MSVYYFHFRNGTRQYMPDLYGETLPDLAAAQAVARQTATEMAASDDGDRWRGWRVEVADESGATLASTPVFEASQYH
jgi:hypothetical protein